MKALKDGVAAYATELVMTAGAILVSLGAGMIYLGGNYHRRRDAAGGGCPQLPGRW